MTLPACRRALVHALALALLAGCAPALDTDRDASADVSDASRDRAPLADAAAAFDTAADGPVVEDDAPAPLDASDDVARVDGGAADARADAVARDAAPDAPLPTECRPRLRALGVTFTAGPAARGIDDPVTVTTPINGVHFRYATVTGTERPLLMDCRLALALHALTARLRTQWRIETLVHIGIYNYRCIAGTDPCVLSQHSYATALDIGGFRDESGRYYSVLNDFVTGSDRTCPLAASNTVDRVLKEIACWMYDSRTFNIILTPNYNAAHRNHYHVDLTRGSHFIGTPLPGGVDPLPPPWLPAWWYDDE